MSLLAGRYETLKTIASGGMGTVHLGRAVGVGGFERLVAIKIMHPHFAHEQEFVRMFLDEARLAALIRHPNVVATIDVQEAEEALFLVMEYVEGASLTHLRQALWSGGERLPLGICVRLFIDVLAGLQAAHEQQGSDGEPLNLVHRDVSPPNILVGVDGITRLTDFGVARAETRLSSTRGGKLKGKLPYMPPEQIMSEPIDRRCDIYAAGVVLWEELTGRRLFKSESEGGLLQLILTGPAQTAREAEPSVPEAIDDVCMRAMAGAPDARFATAAAFGEALEEAAMSAGVPIATSRVVSSFIKQRGLYEPVDRKSLSETPASGKSRPKLGSDAAAISEASGPSGHTGVEATISASGYAPITDPRASRRWLFVAGAGAIALGGLVALRMAPGLASDAPAGDAASASEPAASGASADAAGMGARAESPAPAASPVASAPPSSEASTTRPGSAPAGHVPASPASPLPASPLPASPLPASQLPASQLPASQPAPRPVAPKTTPPPVSTRYDPTKL